MALSLFPLVLASVMVTITIAAAALLFGLPLHWSTRAARDSGRRCSAWLAFLPLALLLAAPC